MIQHEYTVERVLDSSGVGRWDFYVDTVRKRYLYDSDPAINCWIASDRDSQWYGETWDGGDGYADDGDRLNFTVATYKSDNGTTWSGPGWTPYPVPCNHEAENSNGIDYKCKRPSGTDKFNIWSIAW